MTSEAREKIAELFEAALEKDPATRDLFIDEACDDPEIRAEVRSLLKEHEIAGTFMEAPFLDSISSGYAQSSITEPASVKISERYEILAELGRGGMGFVLKARDRVTNELVALKVLNPQIASDKSSLERFKNELRLAHKITHKNVCSIHHFDVTDNVAYISMELVEGETLRKVLARLGGLPLRKGIQVALQICQGLREAHDQGIVHRDLKPENIMIDDAGNAKIMDFGIARLVGAELTHSTAIGTPAYMAPEQFDGTTVDARTDIYSLGLILYELFTGRKQGSETPLSPREVEPTIPPSLEDIILKSLKKKPADRFQSVDELESALIQASTVDDRQGRGVTDRILTTLGGQPHAITRLVVSGALLIVLIGVGFIIGKRSRPSISQTVALKSQAIDSTSPMHHDAEVYWVAFSPNKQLLASASEDKTIKVWNISTMGETLTLLGHTRAVTSVAFSPDGRRLASASSDRTVKIWDAQSGQLLRSLNGHADEVNSVAYSPDGRWLISGSADKTVRVWDPETGETRHTLSGHSSVIEAVCFSQDGKWIASASYDETVRLWDALNWSAPRILRGHADRVEVVAFSPDSRWLASGSDDNLIKIWDTSTGQEFRTLAGHKGWVNGLAFSPDGMRLASASADGTIKVWEVTNGRQIQSFSGEGGGISGIAFGRDSNTLATGDSDGNVKVWSLNQQK